MSPTSEPRTTTRTPRWSIRVTYPTGEEAWLRHGGSIGEGDVVRFSTRRLADLNVEFIRDGLEEGTTVTVVRV